MTRFVYSWWAIFCYPPSTTSLFPQVDIYLASQQFSTSRQQFADPCSCSPSCAFQTTFHTKKHLPYRKCLRPLFPLIFIIHHLFYLPDLSHHHPNSPSSHYPSSLLLLTGDSHMLHFSKSGGIFVTDFAFFDEDVPLFRLTTASLAADDLSKG